MTKAEWYKTCDEVAEYLNWEETQNNWEAIESRWDGEAAREREEVIRYGDVHNYSDLEFVC